MGAAGLAEVAAGDGLGPQGARDVVLRAEHVSVVYDGDSPTRAVRDVSIELRRGEVLGIAGESGCGKSTLAYALMRMLRPPARLTAGSISFSEGIGAAPVDVMGLGPEDLRRFRWTKLSMVFQSAMNALNPVTSLRKQFSDIFETHAPEMRRDEREQRSRALLDMVGIDPARISSFPHELSGGMRQRVVIAMALALHPDVVIMDEPTTALDVVVQREILDEIERLREELGFSIVFITHDLSLLLEISDRLAVMYAGEIVEFAPSVEVARAPAHPYTLGLLESFPDMRGARRQLHGIAGSPPSLAEEIAGCAFAPRCGYAFAPCESTAPRLRERARATGHAAVAGANSDGEVGRVPQTWSVACHLHDEELCPAGPPRELDGGDVTGDGEVVNRRPVEAPEPSAGEGRR
jgi:peptide/nickel transport system ATP-binding protein